MNVNNFDGLIEIPKRDFMRAQMSAELAREPMDSHAFATLANHAKDEQQRYYVVRLAEEGVSKLIFPCHSCGGDISISQGGEPLKAVIPQFMTSQGDSGRCWQKVYDLKNTMAEEFGRSGKLWPESMPLAFVCNNGELAVHGAIHFRDHGRDKLYVGNFHRLVAYGWWIEENGYQPLTVYYCEVR